jgi:hypothetical protein
MYGRSVEQNSVTYGIPSFERIRRRNVQRNQITQVRSILPYTNPTCEWRRSSFGLDCFSRSAQSYLKLTSYRFSTGRIVHASALPIAKTMSDRAKNVGRESKLGTGNAEVVKVGRSMNDQHRYGNRHRSRMKSRPPINKMDRDGWPTSSDNQLTETGPHVAFGVRVGCANQRSGQRRPKSVSYSISQ